jgi:23S rRNA (cytidine1920-2'-O)/16S rRNA (cytidine1409-2'-O)-methyltransferase
MAKIRLDTWCASQGLSTSREQAQKEIMTGLVSVNGETVRQPSKKITGEEDIIVNKPDVTFVSRGGFKLQKALDYFSIDVTGIVSADMGASTGGFTDCMLQRGAVKVYSVDVGYGQFDYRLRNDQRVVLYERTNVKDLEPDHFSEPVSFISADLSFISITKVNSHFKELFPKSRAVYLVKPQFEAQPGEHKKGVVRTREHHCDILMRTGEALMGQGISIMGITWSPVTGPKGNIEFLFHVDLSGETPGIEFKEAVVVQVDDAHSCLK